MTPAPSVASSFALSLYILTIVYDIRCDNCHAASRMLPNECRQIRVSPCAIVPVCRSLLTPLARAAQVGRHVHSPSTHLFVIVGVTVSSAAVSSTRAIQWLLRNEFSRIENGALSPPELLGLGAAIYERPEESQPLLSVRKQIMSRPNKSGVVLCLPRLQLQAWLLAEGRALRGDDGESWSPPWLELEVGAPPPLPVNTSPNASIGAEAPDE